MLHHVRSAIPAFIKRPVRGALDSIDAVWRRRLLTRCAVALRQQAHQGRITPGVVEEMCDVWGNKGFSADESFVVEVAKRMMSSNGPFLECGSGISTIVAGAIADGRGLRLISLEQDAEWYAKLSGFLKRLEYSQVELWHTPLKKYADFVWYDLDNRTMPDAFTQVFCDGPFVSRSVWAEPYYSSWRVGLVPILQERNVRLGEIVLDDAIDVRSDGLRRRWAKLGIQTEIIDTPSGTFVLGQPSR